MFGIKKKVRKMMIQSAIEIFQEYIQGKKLIIEPDTQNKGIKIYLSNKE